MTLKTTTLGQSGPTVNALGVGLMSIGHAYGHGGSDEERLAFLDELWSMGETFWDDADIYGDSEELVGKWFTLHPERRKDIFLATKFGFVDPTKMPMEIRSDPEYVKQAFETSLKKLKTDYVDLYYCHRPDDKTPIEETVKAMVELKNAGKIRHIGLSEIVANDLRRASKIHHIAAVQTEYSPWALEPETEGILQACRELGVALIAYSPLGRGFLTGQLKKPEDVKDDARSMFPRFYPENFDKNLEIVHKLEAIAKKKGVKPSQLGLAWLMKQGDGATVLPIFGTRSANRVKENLEAENIQLSEQEDKEIREVVQAAGGGESYYGDRYPKMMQHLQLRETVPLKG